MSDAGTLDNSLTHLRQSLGGALVVTDERVLSQFRQDLFYQGHTPCAVITPDSQTQLVDAVRESTRAGFSVVPRGGGMSYSAGYVADRPDAVLLDTRQLDQVLEINSEDMFVTVETGVTWAALDAALAPLGLRTPFWGTGSGKYATVGASLSQNALNYGSGQHGAAAQSVLSLDVVTADGRVITTGSAGNDVAPTPFLRHYGPDLTGVFIGDCGALGIKSKATLQLIKRPKVTLYAAYDFENVTAFCEALSEIARHQVTSECFGFDPGFMSMRTTYSGVKDGLKLLSGVAKAAGSMGAGLKEAMKVAAAGRRYLKDINYSIHITVDGRDTQDATSRLETARTILGRKGKEIEASMPKVMRGTPFPDPTIILGHDGELWIPMHGIVPHSKLKTLLAELDIFMNTHADVIEAQGIAWGITAVPAGPSGILVEPNLYWRDKRSSLLESYLPESYLNQKQTYAENASARATVTNLREGMIDVYRKLGAVHMQIGRVYPYLESRSLEVQNLLRALKAQLDPDGRMNPGCLGL